MGSKDEELKAKDGVISERDATIKFQDALLAEYRSKLQIPTEVGETRKLVPKQRRVLVQELKRNIDKFPKIIIYTNLDTEPRDYAKQFADLFSGLGIVVIKRDAPNATELGLFVGIKGNEPSETAKLFMSILTKANIEAHYTPWVAMPSTEEDRDIDYDLYVARPFW